jgi:hypothetical protein
MRGTVIDKMRRLPGEFGAVIFAAREIALETFDGSIV